MTAVASEHMFGRAGATYLRKVAQLGELIGDCRNLAMFGQRKDT